MGALQHEGTHEAGFGEGVASIMGNVAASVWTDQNTQSGRTTNTSPDPFATQSNWLADQHADPVQNAIISQGNQFVSGVTNGEALPAIESVNSKNKEDYNNYGDRYVRVAAPHIVSSTPKEGYKKRKVGHEGDDIAASQGTPIVAVAGGEVVFSGKSNGYGNLIVLKSETNNGTYLSYYGHQDRPSILQVGQKVAEGQKVGVVGNTVGGPGSDATGEGNHLHIGIQKADTAQMFQHIGWIDPSTINIGKYNKLQDTPAYKEGKSK